MHAAVRKKVSRYNGSIISLPFLPMLANPQSRLCLLAAALVASVSLGACSSVTDRTTWGVRVLGNPVHLTS